MSRLLSKLLPAAAAAGLLLLLSVRTSHPEVVRIVGPAMVGHGYMFMDGDRTCRVATAAHVVQDRASGELLRTVTVIDRFGRHQTGTAIARPDPDIDVAFLTVLAGAEASDCTLSRLGLDDLSRRLNAASDLTVDTMTETGEQIQIPARLKGKTLDGAGGSVFAIAGENGQPFVAQGLSGSPVRDRTTALGLITNEDQGLAVAVRMDVVKRLFREKVLPFKPPRLATVDAGHDVVLSRGRPEPGANIQDVLSSRPVAIGAEAGQIELEIWLQKSRVSSGVSLQLEGSPASLTVATIAEPDRRSPSIAARVCELRADVRAVACSFIPRRIHGIRLTLFIPTAAPVRISHVQLLD